MTNTTKRLATVDAQCRAKGIDPAALGVAINGEAVWPGHPAYRIVEPARGGFLVTNGEIVRVWKAEAVRRLLARADCAASPIPEGYTGHPIAYAETKAILDWHRGCGIIYGGKWAEQARARSAALANTGSGEATAAWLRAQRLGAGR